MKNILRGSLLVTLLLLCLLQISLNFAPFALGETTSGRKEFWQVVNVTNTQPYNTVMDLNVTVNSRNGVNIACSNNVTAYYQNLTYWQGLGYMSYFDWLNGTSTLTYNWDQMDWYVSNGSLTAISYSDIQFWGDMYLDSGGVNYTTFMGNTFMADWNLSSPYNNPDIISLANWQGNQIKMISGLMVPNNTMINVVFDIVMTQAGSFTFNITTTPGVTVTPSTWTAGGASTILVPNDKPTIPEAISSANPGDTIVVGAGTYHESQVLINKPLKLMGSGPGTTIIDGQLVAPPTVGLVRITESAGDAAFSGFTLKNAGKTSNTRVAIYVQSASSAVSYTISNNAIYGTNNPDDDQDYGLYAYQGNESLVFANNSITQTGANPILIEQHSGPVEISYNTLDVGVWGSDAIFCMTYGGYNITTLQRIKNNTINMGTGGNPFDIDHRATGITFASAYNSAVLGNGTFTNIQIMGNTIFNLASYRRGITLWNSATGDGTGGNIISASITGNTINGTGADESYGIRLLGLVTNASISGNNITNNAYGIDLNNATGVLVTNNNIFGNSVFGIDNTGSQPLSAKYNWWGNETGPHTSASQYPNSPGDNVSDNVIFGPWLIKPYPPAVPISATYVDPPVVALTAPALGTVFTANVTIGNVTMMYGYQYVLQWDNSLLNLLQVTDRIPTVWGTNYFITQKSQKPGNYSFAVAARAPAPPFNGSTAVASFTFKTMYDPMYPNNASCLLALTNVTIGNPAPAPILSVISSGNYSINSVISKLLFMASPYVATHVPKEFDATINATSVVNLGGFDFTCYFNTTLLNVMYLTVSSSLGGLPVVVQGWSNIDGYFHLNVTGIAPANGTVILATAHFKVEQGFVWSTLAPTVNGSLFFASSTFVNQTGGSIDHDAINGTYVYKPLQGDASMDGTVDIVDLVMVAQGFGMSTGDPQYALYINADINRDGTIDILDIIYVAHNFGSSTGS